MVTDETIYMAGSLVAAFIAGVVGYMRRPRASTVTATDSVIAGVGLELGRGEQMERLIAETKRAADGVNRVADIMENKRQAGIEERLDDFGQLLQRLAEAELAQPRSRR